METTSCSPPLYNVPRPYFTADFNRYFLLLNETVQEALIDKLENDAIFIYVQSGMGVIAINGETFSLHPGCACFLQNYHVYSLIADGGATLELAVVVMDYPLQSYSNFSFFDPKQLEESFDLIPLVSLSPAGREKMQELLCKCEGEDRTGDGQSPLIKTALYSQIRLLFRREAARSEAKAGFSCLPLGWRAWLYLTKFSAARIGPAEVAGEFQISVSQLNRELRRISSYDCRRLLARARVMTAASMLLFNDLSIQNISNCAGFSSENVFYRNFKEWRGMTPQECRKRMLSPHNRCPRQQIHEKPYAVLNYIACNYRGEISLKTASQALFLSETVINQIAMDFFQYPFYRLVTNWRMRHGETLLICTSLPICDIAVDLGFNSVHTFSRLFKERNQMTPGQFRKERRIRS